MRLDKFYVVARPTPLSGLGDICFESNAQNLMLQALGGLKPGDVIGIYTEKEEAIYRARDLLDLRAEGRCLACEALPSEHVGDRRLCPNAGHEVATFSPPFR